jgi:hypothetical protein
MTEANTTDRLPSQSPAPWAKPVLKRLNAGSAENDTNANADFSDMS